MEINFGPQHPSTHGVLRVLLKVDGERILDAKPIIGYLHRGTEKLFEHMAYPQCIPHTDRMDYVASATNNLGFVETVEKLMGVTKNIPRRAQLIRVMLSELQRISSHLLWLATHAIDIGAMTPFFYCFREREQILDLFEAYCGARLTLNCMRIGGMPEDLPHGWLDDLEAFADKFDGAVDEYESLLTDEPHLEAPHRRHRRPLAVRGDRVGHHRTAAARLGGRMGSAPRAAVRDAIPSSSSTSRSGKNGDTYDRYLVRMAEMRQSNRILKQCIPLVKATPAGDIKAKISKVVRPPEGEVYHSIESPKGELGYYIVVRRKNAERVPLPRATAELREPSGAAGDVPRDISYRISWH